MSARIIFAGSPEFAVPSLRALIQSDVDIVRVLTQPDRPSGRGQSLRPTPIKQLAEASGLSVATPTTLKEASVQNRLRELAPDVMVVVAYGLLLPQAVLDIPRLGCVNVHPSLLPRWRGAAPIQHTILSGDPQTGVAIMKMDAGMDTGPILRLQETPVHPMETSGALHHRLAQTGATLLVETLLDYLRGDVVPQPQCQEGATRATKLTKAMAALDWTQTARHLDCQVRGLNPWPVATTRFGDEVLRVHEATVLTEEGTVAPDRLSDRLPGTLVAVSADGVDVATGQGVLRLLTVQRAGAKPVSAQDFLNANQGQLIVGEVLFT